MVVYSYTATHCFTGWSTILPTNHCRPIIYSFTLLRKEEKDGMLCYAGRCKSLPCPRTCKALNCQHYPQLIANCISTHDELRRQLQVLWCTIVLVALQDKTLHCRPMICVFVNLLPDPGVSGVRSMGPGVCTSLRTRTLWKFVESLLMWLWLMMIPTQN